MKRRHHFVPQALTRNFTDEGQMLYLYDGAHGTIRRASTRDVFVTRDFYLLPEAGIKVDREVVENTLAELEGNWSQSLRNVSASRIISAEDRGNIAVFVAAQYIRTPAVRKGVAKLIEGTVLATARALERHGEMPPMPPELKKYGQTFSEVLEKKIFSVRVGQSAALMPLVHIPKIGEMIAHMNWAILDNISEQDFIVSDNPVSVFDRDSIKHFGGIGLIGDGIELILPLSRKMALLASWDALPEQLSVRANKVQEINRRSAFFAERFFVAPIHSKKLMAQMRPYLRAQPSATAQNIPAGDSEYIISRIRALNGPLERRLYQSFAPIIPPEASGRPSPHGRAFRHTELDL